MKERVSTLGEVDDDLDLSGFKTKAPAPKPPAETVRAIAEAADFPSREPVRSRAPRLYRTGRTQQFSVRASPQTIEAIYAIADGQGWQVSETIERMLAALQRELKA